MTGGAVHHYHLNKSISCTKDFWLAFAFLHIFHENSCRQNNADPDYRKNSKNWDTLNYYRDCPTNVIVGFYSAILRPKDADRITNRVDTDQTAP